MILDTISKRFLDKETRYDGNYNPVYLNFKGQEVEMQKNSAFYEIILNRRQLSFSPDSPKTCYILLDDL